MSSLAINKIAAFVKKNIVMFIALLAAVITMFFVPVDKLYLDYFDYKTDRNLSEVFVESIAFIVADYFGLDTSMCSFNYITAWAKGDPKVVLELGDKVQKCANEFIEKIEKYKMQELELAA